MVGSREELVDEGRMLFTEKIRKVNDSLEMAIELFDFSMTKGIRTGFAHVIHLIFNFNPPSVSSAIG